MCGLISSAIMLSLSGIGPLEGVDQQAASQRFVRSCPAPHVDTDAGGVTRISGGPLSFGASPAESAAGFVENSAAALGAAASDLVPGNHFNNLVSQPVMYDARTGRYKFTLLYHRQQRNGIPVFGSELRLLIRNADDHPLVWASSTLKPLGDFTLDRSSLNTLFNSPEQVAPQMTRFTAVQPVIWAGTHHEPAVPRLAVTFEADNLADSQAAAPQRWRFIADGATGAVLHRESLISFAEVTGSVQGRSTEGLKPDFCDFESPRAMPYAQVEVAGGDLGFADAGGDFVLQYSGVPPVSVVSPMLGRYFTVDNFAGDEETLTQAVSPPTPAVFMHNAQNREEFVRAQVNGYVHANIVRDFCLAANPSYPTIATQTGFLVVVNRDGMGCPGNGWYAIESINLCRAEAPFPNMAYSAIVHHEYGHHIVQMGGSAQWEYGQGMADTVAVLIADHPHWGYGIFGDCDEWVRTAENDVQYPCGADPDYCSQLLSGCIWDTRQELAVTDPDAALTIISSLTINSVLLHQGAFITPDITIDFLTLDDDDGMLSNGTPHSTEICSAFGAHGMDCPLLTTGDLDYDGDVDAGDFALLAPCLMGPSVTAIEACEHADVDGDTDCDLTDFALFQLVFDPAVP